MNANEPIAWMTENGTIFDELPPISGGLIPLYTHLAKTLTDEEIYKIANSIETIQPQHGLRLSNDLNVMDFARAILRKAQDNG